MNSVCPGGAEMVSGEVVRLPANNIQWLRLIFALQVLISHLSGHLGLKIPYWIGNFPGVPAFFFVSGFLIYGSYSKESGSSYARNRFLRIFPGLLAVTIGGACIVLYFKGVGDLFYNYKIYMLWIASQITLVQAYAPSHFLDVGTGYVNGSLWTITVEIIFYFMVPFIFYFQQKSKYAVILLSIVSFIIYACANILDITLWGTRSVYGALAMTPIAWGWMFGIGIWARLNFSAIYPYLKYAPILFIPIFIMAVINSIGNPFIGSQGNHLGVFYFIPLSFLILWASFVIRLPQLRPDFSYGLYIWHMPIINLVIAAQLQSRVLWAFGLTWLMAIASWYLVERPCIALKDRKVSPSRISGREPTRP